MFERSVYVDWVRGGGKSYANLCANVSIDRSIAPISVKEHSTIKNVLDRGSVIRPSETDHGFRQ